MALAALALTLPLATAAGESTSGMAGTPVFAGPDNPVARCYHSAFYASRSGSSGEYLSHSQLQQGVSECTQALRKYSLRKKARAQVYLHRGLLNRHLLRSDLALRDFRRAQRVAGDSPAISVNIGNIHYLRGEFGKAISAYNRALEMEFPAAHKAYLNRGLASERLGNKQHAIDAYVAALALQPSLAVAQERLAVLTQGSELVSARSPASGSGQLVMASR